MVELPSQFMENYGAEKEFLRTFAFHYKTGEPLPDELIERIRKSRNFMVAYGCMRQVSFGLLDMAYYTKKEAFTDDIIPFEKKAWQKAMVLEQLKDTCMTRCSMPTLSACSRKTASSTGKRHRASATTSCRRAARSIR